MGLEQLVAAGGPRVALPDGVLGSRDPGAVGIDDRAVRALDPVPTLVAVHRVVAPMDRRDPARNAGKQLERASRGHVAPVEERVHDDGTDPLASGELDDGREVLHVRVHTPRRDEPHQVEGPAIARGGACGAEGRVREGRSVVDRVVDAHELLVVHVPRAHRQVPHLAVAHDAVGKADVAAARAKRRMRVTRRERTQTRRFRAGHRVRWRVGRQAPPIENAQHDRAVERLMRSGHANARTIAPNSSASSDAPPTRAPSMPSAFANSPTDLALTLPP